MPTVVTIGLCVKNEEKEVGNALKSVLNQDFPHESMEIIAVDGCSKDRTVQVIEKVLSNGDMRYKILFESEGLGYARQMVSEGAKGDYIIWVDGDIRLSRAYTRKQVEFMETHPDAGIAAGMYGYNDSESVVAALENLAYVVDSIRWSGGKHPRLPPTEGSVFRVRAVRQIGGFDGRIRGACEDIEVAYKMRRAGWSFYVTSALFYEKCQENWKGLWDQYSWWGYGGHYVFHKDWRINPIFEMIPPAGFIAGVVRTPISYRMTSKKTSFLLPLHGTFKRIAWCFGFIRSHLDGYGHSK